MNNYSFVYENFELLKPVAVGEREIHIIEEIPQYGNSRGIIYLKRLLKSPRTTRLQCINVRSFAAGIERKLPPP